MKANYIVLKIKFKYYYKLASVKYSSFKNEFISINFKPAYYSNII